MSLPVESTKKDLHERLKEWAKQRPPPSFPSSSLSSTSSSSSSSSSTSLQPSTISISNQGDLAMICKDNKLWIGTSQHSGNSERIIELPSDAEKMVTNIEFNFDGTLLMLYGPKFIGMMSFPITALSRQIKNSSSTTSFLDGLDLKIIELIPEKSNEKILKL